MDKLMEWLSYRMPMRLLYWCVVRAGAYATTQVYTSRTPYEVGIIDLMDAVDTRSAN